MPFVESFHYDAEKKQYTLTTRQVTAPTHEQQAEKQALHIPLDIDVHRVG
ncbi:DUF3458 domain-containing protein [Vibrio chagasii]|nr:DUF3458 domain-containing protein [Vibrio chagasii]